MAWTTPKTTWVTTDYINVDDFNRIKNNLKFLKEYSRSCFNTSDLEDMGSNVGVSSIPNVNHYNALENNLETFNNETLAYDIGTKKTFVANGSYITASELNRIEKAELKLYESIKTRMENIKTLSFTLGTDLEV